MGVITNAPAAGWRGYLRVGGAAGYVYPYSSEDITKKIALYRNEGIHGGGAQIADPAGGLNDGVFGSRINAATGQISFDGTIRGDVFGNSLTGNFGKAFLEIMKRAIGATSDNHLLRVIGFTKTDELVVSPGGGMEYVLPGTRVVPAGIGDEDKCVISRLRLSGNRGGNVTMDATLMATYADFHTNIGPDALVGKPAVGDFDYEAAAQAIPTGDDNSPLPYWRSAVTVSNNFGEASSVANQITDWSIEVNNNSAPLFAFNGDPYAVNIIQGKMHVTGSLSYYKPAGNFTDVLQHGGALTITLGDITLKSDYIMIENPEVPAPAMNEPAVRTITFECMASDVVAGHKASLYMV